VIEPTTLARPYARAAFEHAREAKQLDVWKESLAQLAALTLEPKVAATLRRPDQTAAERAGTLMSLAGESLPQAVGNLLHVLADNGRLALLPEVAALFEQFKQSVESAVAVHVTSAYPLSDAEANQLSASMEARLARSVTSETDPSLLGGALIRANDLVIDGSIRGRLNKLAGSLNQ
jgi:F-type H+-transporting ATPase subunit delta